MAWYNIGTVTATNNSGTLTGVGMAFISNIRVGDGLTIAGSTSVHEVTNIISETQLTFSPVYTGTTGSGKTYSIIPVQGYVKDLADQAKSLLVSYSSFVTNPNLAAFAGVTGAADKLPYFTSAAALATTGLSSAARGVIDKATVGEMNTALGLGIDSNVTFGRNLYLRYDPVAVNYSARISSENATNLTLSADWYIVNRSSLFGIASQAANCQYLFREGRMDCVNYANTVWANHQYQGLGYFWKNTSNVDVMSLDSGGNVRVTGSLNATVNVVATGQVFSNKWFYSAYSGGATCMSTGNLLTFHWNNGFYYNIDGNGWVLINSSPSDRSVKNVEADTTAEEAGELIDQLAEKSVKFSYKQNAPLQLPEGSRHGFIAQEVEDILPTLFKETGAPGADEEFTLLTYNDDAPYQLISLLVKTVSELRGRVAALEQQLL